MSGEPPAPNLPAADDAVARPARTRDAARLRDDRRKAALKANMARRKAQTRARRPAEAAAEDTANDPLADPGRDTTTE